jgi:hypothetical protein
MDFRDLFRAMGFDRFLRDYYLRLPLSLPNVLEDLTWPRTWEEVAEVLCGRGATLLIVRNGVERWGAPPATADEAKQLIAEGWTINIRHAERHSARLHELARGLAATFVSPVDIQMFITPAGKPGFAWHIMTQKTSLSFRRQARRTICSVRTRSIRGRWKRRCRPTCITNARSCR